MNQKATVFCDVTEAKMKINRFSLYSEGNKHTFIKKNRTNDFDIRIFD